jgi:hypothetical protein
MKQNKYYNQLWQDKEFCTSTYSKKNTFKYKKAKNKAMIILLILLHTFRGIQYL